MPETPIPKNPNPQTTVPQTQNPTTPFPQGAAGYTGYIPQKITSAANIRLPVGGGTFAVKTGPVRPVLTASGLPHGVSFTDHGDGSGTLTSGNGSPTGGPRTAPGTFPIKLTLTPISGPVVVQDATLTIN
jgi:hypothetical protein